IQTKRAGFGPALFYMDERWPRRNPAESMGTQPLRNPLLLAQRAHRQRNVVSSGANPCSSLAGIWRGSAGVSGGGTLRRPEHVAQHAGCDAGAIGRYALDVASGGIFER